MEIFSFKSRKNYACFEFKYLTLFMVLIPCTWTQDNIPSFNVSCDYTGLYVKIAFSKPFSGVIFAKGHRFDPICSVTESSALDGYLNLPLMACGTYVHETNLPWITNTVVVQHHPLIRTTHDFEKLITCSQPQYFNHFWNPPLLLDQIYESYSLPLTKSSDSKLGSDVFHEHSTNIFDYSYTHLSIFRLVNGTVYNDVAVKSCIAHDAGILDGNASFHQIINPQGCFTVNSENSSGLTILETKEGVIAYVKAETLKMESSEEFYLTCEVLLCKDKCTCSENEQPQKEYPTSVISHKLTKRSTDLSSETFSLKQYEARTRYLKSTVKALMDSIMNQKKENDKKTKVVKRAMRLDDSDFLFKARSLGHHNIITSTEIFSPEIVSTEFYNIEPHLADIYKDYDPDDSDHDYKEEHDYSEELSSTTELSTTESDMVVVILPKESEDNGTEIFPGEELEKNGTTVLTDDEALLVNEAIENTKTATDSDFPPSEDGAIDHSESCVPRLRFLIVIVVMGFFIGCLLLASCGMVLYIRKEKKRTKINDFLLYSIGF